MDPAERRLELEREHGRWLAEQDPDRVWGWDTPAGALRAERRADWIIGAAALEGNTRALEVGCGSGAFTEKFSRSGAQLTALDLSPELLALARQRAGMGQNVTFVQSSLEAYRPSKRFDAVIGSSILHHLHPKGALQHIRSLLKPGGRLAFAEPNGMNPQIFLQKRVGWLKQRVGDVASERDFQRWQLARMLREAGFHSVTVLPRDWLHPATPESLIPIVRRLEPALESVPLLREFAGSLYFSAQAGS